MPTLTRRDFLRASALGAAALAAPAAFTQKPRRRPNILLILADDLGWMDTQVYGSEYYETPNIDRLAARGMLFTNAYATSPLCSPTRASIMTGKYPHRFGITAPACHLKPLREDQPLLAERAAVNSKMVTPQSRRFMPLEEYTIGEAMRDAGYATGFIGKWHLGLESKYWPREQGFEFDLGAPNPGPPSYFSPYRFPTIDDGPEGEYITDRVTDEAVAYLESASADQRPFFLCLWHFAVHAPYQSKDELTEKYRGKTDPRGEQDSAIMGGMIESMDQGIGRVLDKLDELGIADDTIIIFASDNGGNMYDKPEGTTPTNNAPLRNGKGSIYEGGVREPLLVVWPGVVQEGFRSDALTTSIDLYPTILEMAGAQAQPGQTIDGLSIVPVVSGAGALDREAIFCHFPHYIPATGNLPATSVCTGEWKLIRHWGEGPGREHGFELYNLREDIGETNNLAAEMPARVTKLDRLIDQHLAETQAVVPIKNPAYDPDALAIADTWRPAAQAKLSMKDGVLVVDSTGGDPFIWTGDVPDASGELVARFRMKSGSSGPGQFFWADAKVPRFGPTVRLDFTPTHDGEWHEYGVPFTTQGKLRQIRIDPSTAPGRIELDWVRVCKPDGAVLKEWQFED